MFYKEWSDDSLSKVQFVSEYELEQESQLNIFSE